MNPLTTILQVLIFPGLLFTGVIGLVTTWVDRKVTARVQMRVGPPFLQPLYDIIKLMIKETCVPAAGSPALFLSAPVIGLGAVTLASTILWRVQLPGGGDFVGDLIVVLYLLTMPAMSVVLGSFASGNPLAFLGGSREMKLILSYELPFLLAVFVPIILSRSIRLDTIAHGVVAVTHASGIIAFVVALVCTQAKLTLVPFDAPEAETELTGGAYIEYSGPPLAMFKLTRAMMLFTMPVFLITVYGGGFGFDRGVLSALAGIAKYLLVIVLIVLGRNTAPRIRTDQIVKFFWGPITAAALVAVILALWGW